MTDPTKKRRIRRFLAAAGVALGVPLATVAYGNELDLAAGEPEQESRGISIRAGELAQYLHGLDLSASQREQISAILAAQEPLLQEKLDILARAEDGLRELGAAPGRSEEKARLCADAVLNAVAAVAALHQETDQQLYALLTPRQRLQLASGGPGFATIGGNQRPGRMRADPALTSRSG